MSLRRILLLLSAAFASMSACTSAALLYTVNHERVAAREALDAADRVASASDLEAALLDHNRVANLAALDELAGGAAVAVASERIRTLLEAARATTDRSRSELVEDIHVEVAAYESARRSAVTDGVLMIEAIERSGAPLTRAVALLEAHRLLERERAAAAIDDARTWRGRVEKGIVLGLVALLLFVVGAAGVLIAILYRPLRSLERGVMHMGEDMAEALAERGPRELRAVVRALNDRATTLREQRRLQLVFLAGVAHDLKNPILALRLAAEGALARKGLSPERARKALEVVLRQSGRLVRLVDDVLESARIDAGQLDLQRERDDVAALVRRIVDGQAPLAPQHRISCAVLGGATDALIDARRFEQVVTNLLTNAVKYSPPRSVVQVTVANVDDKVELRVANEGIGISWEDQARIFEPFHRTGAAKSSAPGAGLGLWVAARIIEAHGGTISVDSAPGLGATFLIRMPVAA